LGIALPGKEEVSRQKKGSNKEEFLTQNGGKKRLKGLHENGAEERGGKQWSLNKEIVLRGEE